MSRAADDVKPSQESEEDGEKVDVVRQVAMAVIEFACTLHVPSMIDGTSAPVFVVDSVPYSALWTGSTVSAVTKHQQACVPPWLWHRAAAA